MSANQRPEIVAFAYRFTRRDIDLCSCGALAGGAFMFGHVVAGLLIRAVSVALVVNADPYKKERDSCAREVFQIDPFGVCVPCLYSVEPIIKSKSNRLLGRPTFCGNHSPPSFIFFMGLDSRIPSVYGRVLAWTR